MNRSIPQPRCHLLVGTTRVFLAEALILPTGLVIVVLLTRRLGTEGYGLFTLAAAFINIVELFISSFFARATIKFIGDATDWRPVGDTVMRLHLTVSVGTALLVFISADMIGAMLNEPELVAYLKLFVIDIPLFSLTTAQRNILIGLGGFSQRAIITVVQCLTRLILILLLVESGFSVPGVILGSIGASLVGMLIGRFYVRLSPFRRSTFTSRQLLGYAVWLFLYSISIIVYNKLDLFMLKILGGTADQAGIYGAAQNLAHIPFIFGFSFSPLLISTLSRMLRARDDLAVRELSRDAMRVVICLLPFAGMTAGASQEIVVFIFGRPYITADTILAILIFAALGIVMISVNTAILTAAGKPRWTFTLTGPLIPLALLGHVVLIPRMGPVGASLSKTLFAILGSFITVFAVYRVWRVLPPLLSLLRSILISGVAFAMAALFSTPGFFILLKLSLIVLFIPLAFLLLGEFKAEEIAYVRSAFNRQRQAKHPGHVSDS